MLNLPNIVNRVHWTEGMLLSPQHFQHADHFLRVIGDRNKNQNQNTVEIINKPKTNDQNLAQNNNIVRVKPDEETKD